MGINEERKLLIAFIIVILIAGSCKTIAPVVIEERSYRGDYVFERIVERIPDIDTYSVSRMVIQIKDQEEEMNVRGAARIKRDSVVLLSINAVAGVEAARLLFTKDSVKMIDRISNSYFLGSYGDSKWLFPAGINFGLIQGMFFGYPLNYFNRENFILDNKMDYFFENGFISLRYIDNKSIIKNLKGGTAEFKILIDRDFLIRSIDIFFIEENIYAGLKINSYYETEGNFLPEDISIIYTEKNMPLMANIRLSRIEINRNVNFPFTIPVRYQPVKF